MTIWCPPYEECLLEVPLAMQSSTCNQFVFCLMPTFESVVNTMYCLILALNYVFFILNVTL